MISTQLRTFLAVAQTSSFSAAAAGKKGYCFHGIFCALARSVAVMAACGQLHLLVPVKTVAELFLGFCSPTSFHLYLAAPPIAFIQGVGDFFDQPILSINFFFPARHFYR